MKSVITTIAGCMLFAASLGAEVVNKTLAVVNGEPILQSDFEKLANPVFENYKNLLEEMDKTGQQKPDIRKEILQQMINDRLILQESKKSKTSVSRKEIEDGVKEVRSRFKSDEDFKKELLSQALTEKEFEDRIKDQIMMIKLIDREVKAKITAPDDKETEKFYNENKDKMIEPERVRVKHILAAIDEKDPKSEAKALAKIKEVQKKLKAGGDFVDLAKENSDDPGSKDRGGDLGYIMKGDTMPEFEKSAFSLDPGKMSDPVKTKFGYHLIMVTEKKVAVKKTLSEVRDYLKSYLSQQRMEEEYVKWLKGLKDKADIKINE